MTIPPPPAGPVPWQPELALAMVRDMLRIRRMEERAAELYGEQKIRGFLHLYIGEEAVATGAIHALTDHRRTLPLDKKGELIHAHEDFQLVISYNPGYQSLMKDLKQSTKQRFGALDFDYPDEAIETEIVATETGVDNATAAKLVQIAQRARNLKGHGLDEGISTRLLVYAGQLIAKGVEPVAACSMTLVRPLTDDPDMRETLDAAVATFFVQ